MRKVSKLGPWSMYEKLLHLWGNEYSPREIYEKTRHFFYHVCLVNSFSSTKTNII
jgi:NAD+ synthase (glutamine-hydrolysing)